MTSKRPLKPELPIPVELFAEVTLLTLTTEPTVSWCGSSDITVATLLLQEASLRNLKFL